MSDNEQSPTAIASGAPQTQQAQDGDGPFQVAVGMYELASGARLPVMVAGQAQPDGQVVLAVDAAANP